MHTYLRILSYTRPYGKFVPIYIGYTLLAIVFGLMNFTLLKPLFDVIFEQVSPESLEEFRDQPTFNLSLEYFISLFNHLFLEVSETYGKFNVNEYFQSPDGTSNTVWSLFWYYDSTTTIPQFNPSTKEWEMMTPVNRAFVVNTDEPSTSESNMFAMPGIIFDTTSTGIVLAKVYGPLNEAAVPLRKAIPVKSGMTSITAAKKGSPYPVGTPVPVSKFSKELQDKEKTCTHH